MLLTRLVGPTLALSSVVACAPPGPGDPPAPAASTTTPALASAPPITLDAPGNVSRAPTPDAAAPLPSEPVSPLLHDEPLWPSTGPKPRLILTWVAYPFREGSDDGRTPTRRHVELVARIGSVARRIPLGDVRGGLFYQQHMCEKGPSYKGLVASVSFQEGGWMGFDVKRAPADTMTVTSTYDVCGMCEDANGKAVECPKTPEPVVAVFHVPADARIEERIIEVEGSGKERLFECGERG